MRLKVWSAKRDRRSRQFKCVERRRVARKHPVDTLLGDQHAAGEIFARIRR